MADTTHPPARRAGNSLRAVITYDARMLAAAADLGLSTASHVNDFDQPVASPGEMGWVTGVRAVRGEFGRCRG